MGVSLGRSGKVRGGGGSATSLLTCVPRHVYTSPGSSCYLTEGR